MSHSFQALAKARRASDVQKRAEPLISQGLDFVLALSEQWMVALRACLRCNLGVSEGERATALQVNAHAERDRKGSFVGLRSL